MSTEMQNEAEIFRGTTEGVTRFKDHRSVRGTPKAGMPAFVLGEELAEMARTDPRIVVATADLASANRTNDFRDVHPDRFFDFGIAELADGIGFITIALAFFGIAEILRNLDFLKQIFGDDFDPTRYRMLIFGLAMVLIMVWKPRGLISSRQPTAALKERKNISADMVAQGEGH